MITITNNMTKIELDKHFTNLIPSFERAINGTLIKKRKQMDTYAVISELYLYIQQNINKLSTLGCVQKICYNWIRMNITWTNSQLNKKEGVSQHNDLLQKIFIEDEEGCYTTKEDNTLDTTEEDLETKIELELWYNNKKAILATYRANEQDKVKQIIFDCYFKKGITKGLDLAKHLNINKDYASKAIRILKADLREFAKTFED